MPIYLGSNKISLHRGSNEVSEAYLGSTLVYQNKLPYADGLVIHYDGINNALNGHDSSARSWYDLTGNGYIATVTLSGGDAWTSNGLQINNNSTCVRVPYDMFSRPNTVEFVVEIDTLYNYGTLMRSVSQSSTHDSWVTSDGRVTYRVTSSYAITDAALSTGTLYTIAITSTGNSQKIYINGVLSKSFTFTFSSGTSANTDIFASATATNRHIKGTAYGFRFYDKVLSDADILNNYNIDLARFS